MNWLHFGGWILSGFVALVLAVWVGYCIGVISQCKERSRIIREFEGYYNNLADLFSALKSENERLRSKQADEGEWWKTGDESPY